MNSTEQIKLFFDASVLIAAAHSPTSGSGYLLEACRRGRFKPVVTRLILIEAERSIKAKLGEEDLLRFYQLLGLVDFPGRRLLRVLGLGKMLIYVASSCDIYFSIEKFSKYGNVVSMRYLISRGP